MEAMYSSTGTKALRHKVLKVENAEIPRSEFEGFH